MQKIVTLETKEHTHRFITINKYHEVINILEVRATKQIHQIILVKARH